MIVESDFDKEQFISSGKICATIRDELASYIEVGMSTAQIDKHAMTLFKKYDYVSAPVYLYDFPGYVCLSVNDCASHGIPHEDIILKEQDCINIDVSGHYNGYYADTGVTITLGQDKEKQDLCKCSKEMFDKSLELISHGKLFKTMGKNMQTVAKNNNFNYVKRLCGHGIGKTLHDKPKSIYPFAVHWDNRRFKENMLLAIETFVTSGNGDIHLKDDGWSWLTNDKTPCAQYEHTVLITKGKPIILTL